MVVADHQAEGVIEVNAQTMTEAFGDHLGFVLLNKAIKITFSLEDSFANCQILER